MNPKSFGDTDPASEQFLIGLYRKMSPLQRAEKLASMWRSAEMLAEAEIRTRHPNIEAQELKLRVASRRISRELMIAAFGWDPAIHGY